MTEGLCSSRRPWWFKILQSERRWSSRLVRAGQISNQDELFIRQRRVFCLIVAMLIVTLAPRPIRGFVGRCFFVSFGVDELCESVIKANPKRFERLNFGWRAVFKGSRIGFVFNSLYLLINRYDRLPRWIRKRLLVLHFNFLEKMLPQLSEDVFLVKQDYFGPSSILVTLSWHLPLNVVGVQHGLMDTKSIQQRRLYPGVRTRTEYVYDAFYREILSQVKPAFTNIEVLGPPYDCSSAAVSAQVVQQVIFISSGQMRNEGGRALIEKVRVLAELDGLRFLLRPHPSEKGIGQLKDFRLEESSLSSLFHVDPSSTLFIGVFSSLLYQATFKGFRTLWLVNGSGGGHRHITQRADLPNAVALSQDEVIAGTLSSCLKRGLEPIGYDSVSVRLMALLHVSFPSVFE